MAQDIILYLYSYPYIYFLVGPLVVACEDGGIKSSSVMFFLPVGPVPHLVTLPSDIPVTLPSWIPMTLSSIPVNLPWGEMAQDIYFSITYIFLDRLQKEEENNNIIFCFCSLWLNKMVGSNLMSLG